MCFFLLTSLSLLNNLLDYYQNIIYIYPVKLIELNYIGPFVYSNFYESSEINLNLMQVYSYPFIYVFLLVTVLSIIFCLSYNSDELLSFMLYCKIILLSGYMLFFTDSIILFFFAYEMLLVPSFFILYKFAKTRRCVEAAYLMFF
jgi:formate hydrogenlyase subunit 3/multisubunit Na+/H+ antiporter MnhD subunit